MLSTFELDNWLNIPFNLPQTVLPPGQSVVLTSFNTALAQTAWLRFLSVALVRYQPVVDVAPAKTVDALPFLHVGIYAEAISGQPFVYAGMSDVGFISINPLTPFALNVPGKYHVVVVNNSSNWNLEAVASGTIQLIV